ncbi:hypothetical protein GCM10025866_12420 [Naasia aerilata]|uniref:Uncharacterized protein n=2 Tax=Naasia aerilata TaxID=1162966 RepID=A0ABM8GAT7_9MICO|nr:hypothetical protein GCM10025866_12420 [Naasia aerilata]
MTVGGVAVLVPLLLVPGAPLRLLAQAAEPRTDGSRGVREWVALAGAAVRPLARWTTGAVVGVLAAWVFVFTPVLRWIVTDAAGREAGIALLLATGLVLVSAVLNARPGRRSAVTAALPALAWAACGVVLVAGSGLLLADWYGAMGWSTPAIDDQRAGGAVLLGTAAVPLAVLAIVQLVRPRDRGASPTRPVDEDRYRAMLDRALTRRGR